MKFFEIFLSSQTAAAAVASVVEGTSIGGMSKEGKKIQQSSSNVVERRDEILKEKDEEGREKENIDSTTLELDSLSYLQFEDSTRRRKTTNDFSFNISCKLSYFLELLLSPHRSSLVKFEMQILDFEV